jgi:hypothetical protein
MNCVPVRGAPAVRRIWTEVSGATHPAPKFASSLGSPGRGRTTLGVAQARLAATCGHPCAQAIHLLDLFVARPLRAYGLCGQIWPQKIKWIAKQSIALIFCGHDLRPYASYGHRDHVSELVGPYGYHASQAGGQDASRRCVRRPGGPDRDANCVLPSTQTDQNGLFASAGCVDPLDMPLLSQLTLFH